MFKRLTRIFRRSKGSGTDSFSPRTGAYPLLPSADGRAMAVATVYRCVRLLSDSVASLPVLYRRRTRDGILQDAGDGWMDYLLNVQPNIGLSAFDFWRGVVQEMLLSGNAYVVPVYSTTEAKIERLVLCGRCTVAQDTIHDTYTVNDQENRVNGFFREAEILHFKYMPGVNPKTGESVLGYARMAVSIARTGDRETLNRFENGGNVRGIVSNDTGLKGYGEYQDDELRRMAESLDMSFSGGERIVGMPGQTKFQQLSLSSTDMQFLESRKFSVLEICRFFGVHPSFVFSDTSTNYKSAEQANMAFLSHTLAPLLRNIEGELRRKLLTPTLAKRYYFHFDKRALHTLDFAGMADYRSKMLQTGSTVNEMRREMNLPPVDGGDVPMVSANLRNLGELTYPPLPGEEDDPDDNTEGTETE